MTAQVNTPRVLQAMREKGWNKRDTNGQLGIKKSPTVEEYYKSWIEKQKPPMVRKSAVRDYRQHFTTYILPTFRRQKLSIFSMATLTDFRIHLLKLPLSIKTARNIIDSKTSATKMPQQGDTPMPYRILEHNAKHRAIKCLRRVNGKECGGISYHPRHVAERHCPVCKYYHPEPTGEVVPVWEDAAIPKFNPNLSFIFYD